MQRLWIAEVIVPKVAPEHSTTRHSVHRQRLQIPTFDELAPSRILPGPVHVQPWELCPAVLTVRRERHEECRRPVRTAHAIDQAFGKPVVVWSVLLTLGIGGDLQIFHLVQADVALELGSALQDAFDDRVALAKEGGAACTLLVAHFGAVIECD